MRWILVDDRAQEAGGLAAALTHPAGGFHVDVMEPREAREQVLSGVAQPTGMLIDVDLSSIAGERGSGPGIAQDIRIAQKASRIPEFPLVRYAFRGRVIENIGMDPASDDLFDLLLEKDETAGRANEIRLQLQGVSEIYEGFRRWDGVSKEVWLALLGLSVDQERDWCHGGLFGRMSALRKAGLHVAAGGYLRTVVQVDGPLIDEDLLAIRLGVDVQRSDGASWTSLLGALDSIRYRGVGSAQFRRWWANGLNLWWLDQRKSDETLASFPAQERTEFLSAQFGARLIALEMPAGSPGIRPWSRCALAAEAMPARTIPVDPLEAVRLRPTEDFPSWVDPKYVSLREALRNHADARLDVRDLSRLKQKWDVRQ